MLSTNPCGSDNFERPDAQSVDILFYRFNMIRIFWVSLK